MRSMAEGLYSNLDSSSNVDSTRISIPSAPISTTTQRDQRTQTVLVVGSRDLFRSAIRALLESMRNIEVVGEAQTNLETFDMVERLRPSVLLIDNWTDTSVLQPLRTAVPELRIVALSDGDRALPNVDAVLPASADVHALMDAIRCESIVGEAPTGARKSTGPFGLTPREMDIVRSITEGHTNQEIAKKLSISLSTVKHYVTRVFDKLGVFNRVELVIFAMNHNLNELHHDTSENSPSSDDAAA